MPTSVTQSFSIFVYRFQCVNVRSFSLGLRFDGLTERDTEETRSREFLLRFDYSDFYYCPLFKVAVESTLNREGLRVDPPEVSDVKDERVICPEGQETSSHPGRLDLTFDLVPFGLTN